jgi:hypothetical protein
VVAKPATPGGLISRVGLPADSFRKDSEMDLSVLALFNIAILVVSAAGFIATNMITQD